MSPQSAAMEPQLPSDANWREHMSRDDRINVCQHVMAKLTTCYHPTVPTLSLREITSVFESQAYARGESRRDYLHGIAAGLSNVERQVVQQKKNAALAQQRVAASTAPTTSNSVQQMHAAAACQMRAQQASAAHELQQQPHQHILSILNQASVQQRQPHMMQQQQQDSKQEPLPQGFLSKFNLMSVQQLQPHMMQQQQQDSKQTPPPQGFPNSQSAAEAKASSARARISSSSVASAAAASCPKAQTQPIGDNLVTESDIARVDTFNPAGQVAHLSTDLNREILMGVNVQNAASRENLRLQETLQATGMSISHMSACMAQSTQNGDICGSQEQYNTLEHSRLAAAQAAANQRIEQSRPGAAGSEEFWAKLEEMKLKYKGSLKELYPYMSTIANGQRPEKKDQFKKHVKDCFQILELSRGDQVPPTLSTALLEKACKFIDSVIDVIKTYILKERS